MCLSVPTPTHGIDCSRRDPLIIETQLSPCHRATGRSLDIKRFSELFTYADVTFETMEIRSHWRVRLTFRFGWLSRRHVPVAVLVNLMMLASRLLLVGCEMQVRLLFSKSTFPAVFVIAELFVCMIETKEGIKPNLSMIKFFDRN